MTEALSSLETKLGYVFRDRHLLEKALTHSSHARENQGSGTDNEQLEFVGDAVLGLTTSLALFRRFPDHSEGQLSKLKAHLVSEEHLVRVAKRIGLGTFLRLGRGEEKSGGRGKSALLADALEALMAALYLDGGAEVAENFILKKVLEREMRRLEKMPHEVEAVSDYKSRLQEMLHASGRAQPEYLLKKEQGPAHKRIFTVEARIQSRNGELEFSARGRGSTKKRAEQSAAQKTVEYLESLNDSRRE